MPKFTLEFEADSLEELMGQILAMLGKPYANQQAAADEAAATLARAFPEDGDSAEASETPVPNGDGTKRGRGRPKKTTVTPVEAKPETPPEPEPEKVKSAGRQMLEAAATQQGMSETLPPLDVLKAAITTAVRQAQKGEGDPAILGLLPGFKTETGLPFVMNAEEKHRPALFNLIKQAGLTLG